MKTTRTAIVLVLSLAFPVAIGACGSRKPAETAGTKSSTSADTKDEPPPSTTSKSDTVTDAAPPPPPTPGGATNLSGSALDAYNKGVASYNAGDLPGALTAFQQAVSADSKHWVPHYALGLTYERMGRDSDALTEYRTAKDLNPNYDAAHAGYAFLLFAKGSKTEAESYLEKELAKNPKSIGLMTSLAEIKSLQGDSAKAQELAGSALTVEARYEPAMVLIARDHFRRGRVDLATYVLTAILDGQKTEEERAKGLPAKASPPRAPNNPEAHFLRAIILQKQGERLAAAKWFESALKIRPDMFEARLQLGLIRLEANDAEGALEPLKKAVAYKSSHVESHLALGEAYRLAGGQASNAESEYKWVLGSTATLPNMANLKALANYDLGLLYFLTPGINGNTDVQRYDKAVDYWKQYSNAKGTSSGPSWPSDADDLSEQARRAKISAQAGGTGAGGTTPKPAATPTPAPKPTAAPTPAPTPTTAPKPSATPAPTPTPTTPPKPSAAPTPTPAPKPTTAPTPAPTPSTKPTAKPKETF